MKDFSLTAHRFAYLIISGGCLLALVTAFEPQPTGAWHLHGAWLLCGLLPYIVYGSFTDILSDCALASSGVLLLVADLIARLGFRFTAAVQPDSPAPFLLVVLLLAVILPAGVLAGRLVGQRVCAPPAEVHE